MADDQGDSSPKALGELWFLDPEAPRWADEGTTMPDDTWARLRDVLAHEAIGRSATVGVVPISAGRRPARRPRSSVLWGSVAAGVVLIGVGVIVQSIQSTRPVPVVASGAVQVSAPLRATDQELAAPESWADQPARRVLASGTDYQPQTLRAQVTDLLERLGSADPTALSTSPVTGPMTAGTDGFTASVSGIRDCLMGLTKSDQVQALIIDRARYVGSDAGLIILPADIIPADAATGGPQPTATATTPSGDVDIWVVQPDCGRPDPGVLLHLLHQLGGK